jgi:hypothetical protein
LYWFERICVFFCAILLQQMFAQTSSVGHRLTPLYPSVGALSSF